MLRTIREANHTRDGSWHPVYRNRCRIGPIDFTFCRVSPRSVLGVTQCVRVWLCNIIGSLLAVYPVLRNSLSHIFMSGEAGLLRSVGNPVGTVGIIILTCALTVAGGFCSCWRATTQYGASGHRGLPVCNSYRVGRRRVHRQCSPEKIWLPSGKTSRSLMRCISYGCRRSTHPNVIQSTERYISSTVTMKPSLAQRLKWGRSLKACHRGLFWVEDLPRNF